MAKKKQKRQVTDRAILDALSGLRIIARGKDRKGKTLPNLSWGLQFRAAMMILEVKGAISDPLYYASNEFGRARKEYVKAQAQERRASFVPSASETLVEAEKYSDFKIAQPGERNPAEIDTYKTDPEPKQSFSLKYDPADVDDLDYSPDSFQIEEPEPRNVLAEDTERQVRAARDFDYVARGLRGSE